ncbi:hypothetical protein HV079_19285 [Citrobacter freundii]|uniref:hypothetical protein n=1 Tax=Citrobacter freundii TaxID=546 RepID=UPI0015E8F121|nr:hypothetical protein [Citrobacter freundii]QLZ61162.1 hypothetical protein HV079_19285 [Citrobacter freundii]
MKALKFILPLFFLIVFSMVSIFLTGIALYICGELFFFFYKEIEISFSSSIILLLSKISIVIGSFAGLMLWVASSIKK